MVSLYIFLVFVCHLFGICLSVVRNVTPVVGVAKGMREGEGAGTEFLLAVAFDIHKADFG